MKSILKHLSVSILLCTTLSQVLHADSPFSKANLPSDIEVVDLRNIFKTPLGRYGLEFDSNFLSLNHHLIQITGYMVKSDEPELGSFLLSIRPVQLHREDDGQADDLPPSTIKVLLDPSQSSLSVPYLSGLHTFRGTLLIGRREVAGEPFSWISLQLPVINR